MSQELRTFPLPGTHVLVGYLWQNTRLCPVHLPVITDSNATSCRNPLRTERASFPAFSSSLSNAFTKDAVSHLSCLHDTGLEPTYISVDFTPIDGMPVRCVVRDRTNSHLDVRECCRHLLFLFCRLIKFSRDERPVGSLHLFRLGMLTFRCPYLPHYRIAFACSDILYPLSYRLALRLAFPKGRTSGLPRSARIPRNDLDPISTPEAQHPRQGKV